MSIVELQQPVGGVVQLADRDELRRWVKWTLCRHEHLDPDQFELVSTSLVRAGRRCGLSFQLRGVRAVLLRAIWSSDDGRVLFYDSGGSRFQRVTIAPGGPVLESGPG